MQRRSVEDLVTDLRERRVANEPAPVLLLGAGASAAAGVGLMADLYAYLGARNFDEFVRVIEPLSVNERYRKLHQLLQAGDPHVVTPGYLALAALLSHRLLDVVLSTNVDPLLDDALAAVHQRRKDYLLLVNGITMPDRLTRLLLADNPRVKILKLHGDLLYRWMAWTPREMREFVDEIADRLHQFLTGRDVLVVGHSLRDERIRGLLADADTIWYTNPSPAPPQLHNDPRVRCVIGPEAQFEALLPALAKLLHVEVPHAAEPAAAVGPDVISMDDVSAHLVQVLTVSGVPTGTGFVLHTPRCIVTDAYPGRAALAGKNELDVNWSGQRLTAPVRRLGDGPFGPLLLQVPAPVTVPGLALDTTPLQPGTVVHAAVAVGTGVGLSSGPVLDAALPVVDIAPVGRVEGLVSLDLATAPGASGAPVVDDALRVRGFIVAGAPGGGPSMAMPAAAWADLLTG